MNKKHVFPDRWCSCIKRSRRTKDVCWRVELGCVWCAALGYYSGIALVRVNP